jgi:curved DNA-binding protein CbpA
LKDYYQILGVERTSSAADIKVAYYRLVKLFHPDVCPPTPENRAFFNEIVEAYKVLGNLDNRLQYSILLNKDFLERKLMHKSFPDILKEDRKTAKRNNNKK